jgi:hypothetical protein
VKLIVKFFWKEYERIWSGRADLAGKCSGKEHNIKNISSPENLPLFGRFSRPVRPPHLLGGVA